MSTPKRFFKVLRNGRPIMGDLCFVYTLPKDGKPGEWQAVDGDLVRCLNGLHLTSQPLRFWETDRQCYEAEYDEAAGVLPEDWSGELVARRVRLIRYLPWDKVKKLLSPPPPKVKGDGVGVRDDPRHHEDSPALALLQHVWTHEGDGKARSWQRLNSSMQAALRLAIEGQFRFNPDDFAAFARKFDTSYWLNIEGAYARAIAGQHGPNPSAYQAIEKYLSRRPFIVLDSAHKGTKIRLHVGSTFDWHIGLKKRVRVEVTSIHDSADPEQPPYVIACSYREEKVKGETYPRKKIDKRFTITHEDIAAYHAALREFAKRQREAEPAGAAS